MEKPKNITPEKAITDYGLKTGKKLFLIIVALVTYWQLFEYVSESPNITVYLENSSRTSKTFKTKISVKNGSESILENDIVRPISIIFNQKIDSVNFKKSKVNPAYSIKSKAISINFELFNKDEEIIFYLYTRARPTIKELDYRIRNIETVQFFDYQNKSKFIDRVLVWILILLIAILLFCDALVVISKDLGLTKLKRYIYEYPLTKKSKKEFIKGYEKFYKNYKLRIKPPSDFMREVINNLFKSFPYRSEKETYFIKRMADFKTEFYTFYRFRTAFLVISPIIASITICAIILNFFYYDFRILNQHFSLNTVNQTIITVLFIITIAIILFPRSTMNLVFLKRGAKVKF